ncbi:MAG: HEAT repeat domain-containing protein [Nitrospirota bacterium]
MMEINDELKAAKDIIQVFLKSKKILRMYPQNNPIYIKTLEDSYSRFRDFFHYRDEYTLKIRQNDIFHDSEQIYNNPEKEDNLALFFFKDGLREITFKKGLTPEEMEEFLKIISLDFDREVIDDDIVTLLWERDFQNIQYVVDEAFLADEDEQETNSVIEIQERSTDEQNLLKAYEDAFKEEDTVKDVSIVPLSEKDLQLLFKELEKDSLDKTEKLTNILFEIFYASETKEDFSDVTDFLMNAIEFSIKKGDINLITNVLSVIKRILDNKNVDEEIKKYARKLILFSGSEKIITLLGEILDSGQEIDEKPFEDFVKFLEKNSIPSFMKILGELKNIHSRKFVIDALVFLGPKDIVALSNGLNDSRWYVVRNIIYILRKIGDKRSLEYLLKTVTHGDIRVRKEVIRALGELGGSGVLIPLKNCLVDPDIQVSSAALKALGNIASEAAKRIIMDKISENRFKDKDFEEKKEYFEVLSRWKDSEVYNFVVKILKKKTFWGRAKNYENRACAAYCLGLIGNKDALPVLNKCKNVSNKLLREFSYTAVKRIEHGQ